MIRSHNGYSGDKSVAISRCAVLDGKKTLTHTVESFLIWKTDVLKLRTYFGIGLPSRKPAATLKCITFRAAMPRLGSLAVILPPSVLTFFIRVGWSLFLPNLPTFAYI